MTDPTPAASTGSAGNTRWLWLVWQKLALPVYVLNITRNETRLCPCDILVGSTRWLGETEILRLARMTLYPRSIGPDAYLLPLHQRWRILILRRAYKRLDQPETYAANQPSECRLIRKLRREVAIWLCRNSN